VLEERFFAVAVEERLEEDGRRALAEAAAFFAAFLASSVCCWLGVK
jgi:hypothetical protein